MSESEPRSKSSPESKENSNPLLKSAALPSFSEIKPEHIVPAVEQLVSEQLSFVDELLENKDFTYESLVHALDENEDKLNQAWSPVSHMNSVVNSDELRDAYTQALPKLSELSTKMGQNLDLFKAFKIIQEDADFKNLTVAQQKVITKALRDFHLSGVDLSADKKQRYGDISSRLSEICSKFSDNVLDATQAWAKLIEDETLLEGLPENSKALAKQSAEQKSPSSSGFLLTLDIPCYLAVMTFCDNAALREEMHKAYVTRASDQSESGLEFDNADLMDEILKLRHEKAKLLGFDNYADLSLAKKMAESVDEVLGFLNQLADKSYDRAKAELAELEAFAKESFSISKLEPWDIAYYSEKLKTERYDISQEALKPWFPAPKVVEGMFKIASKLFTIHIKAKDDINLWHKDANYYEVFNDADELIAGFYLDLYAREKKRGGAWMDECRVRRKKLNGELQLPVAYLTCNFTPPIGDAPALLTHNEVQTVFHEFGHGLHHMLTRIEEASVSGINGVAWDAVELPSQFMENWCWQAEAIAIFSGHHETGEPLPQAMLDKLIKAKNFQSAMQMVRQLEFSIFDMRIHAEYEENNGSKTQTILNEVREKVAVTKAPAFNRFQNSFAHIFAGGYAAGYYSYKWAEVLSADAFSTFETTGIFDPETGQRFKECILHKGGSEDAMDCFKAFKGEEPSTEALLRHCGIS